MLERREMGHAHDREALVNFTPAQEKVGQALYTHCGIEMDERYLRIANGRAYAASRELSGTVQHIGRLVECTAHFSDTPRAARDWLYSPAARHRYRWFGKVDYCSLLAEEQQKGLI